MESAMHDRNQKPKHEARKPYRTPTLVVYGSIAKLTKGGGSIIALDGASGMGMA